uniref:Uncharacterized protein n=1 Tax=Glossina pallidipes TaxID=7398 RepID=A0A1A9ZCZ1_GLOPL
MHLNSASAAKSLVAIDAEVDCVLDDESSLSCCGCVLLNNDCGCVSCCSKDGGDGGSVQVAMGLYESFMWSPEITIITFIFMINIWVGSVETSSAKFKELAMPAMILVLPTPWEVAALYAAAKLKEDYVIVGVVLKLVAGGVVTVGVLLLNVVFLNPLLVLLDGVLLKEPLGEVNKCSKDDVLPPPPPPPLPPLLLLDTNLVALAAGVEDVTGVAYVKCLAFLPAKAKAKPLSEPAANKLECCAFEC